MYKFINKSTSWLLLASTMFIGSLAHAALNDTGITTCSNETQNGLPCPVAGYPGQDGDFVAPFNFTKLDANGNAMPVTATNHTCVQDNVTGLMWEVKTDDGGLRDKDNTYIFDNAAAFATQVNATNLCGHNDWRIPEPHELASIVDYGAYNPSIDGDFFYNTQSSYYWTNSPYLYGPSAYSWFVNFNYGYVLSNNRYNNYFARCVRAGQLLFPFSFTDQGDGTIKDNNTNLVWAKCSQGQTFANGSCSGSATSLTWQQALQAADGLTLAGQSDWRLPNVKELQSLADYTKYNPAISSTYFPNTPTDNYFWTASPFFNCVDCSWFVHFNNGSVYSYNRNDNNFVRCVRAGAVTFSSFSLTINRLGVGSGTVASNPTGVACGTVCAANFAENTAVTLTATAAAGSVFGGWSSNCANGQVNLTADTTCTVTFNLAVTKPTVTTSAASNISQTSATLNGTVISSGAATVSFEFGPTTGYGTNVAATPSTVYSSSAVAVSANKTGLTCGTAYHYRVKAVNSAGTGLGVDKTFTTSTCPPPTSYTVTASATTIPAGAVGGSFDPSIQTVTAGKTTSFTVTPATTSGGYNTNTAVTGTCPQGSWGGTWGNVWTTGAINQPCTVIFGFTAINAWLAQPNQTVTPEQEFTLAIVAKSTSVKVGQYSFVITFDHTKLALDITYQGTNCIVGICPGTNALSSRTNPQVSYNTITLNGLDTQGVGPGNDLQLLVIHFKSLFITEDPSFVTGVTLKTNLLNTPNGSNIGTGARGATVNVSMGLCGDATGDNLVNIVDALGIARKLVGMPPPPTVEDILADVNKDARVAITDALQIARYSVGLVLPPEVCKIGQAFSNN